MATGAPSSCFTAPRRETRRYDSRSRAPAPPRAPGASRVGCRDPQSIRLTPPSLEPDPRRLQDVAERIGREATRRRYAVNVLAMDDYEVTELPNARRVVFVTSTMGQGDPPANVRLFWRFLLRKSLPSDSLSRLAFACFGLGDSHYQKYNVVAKKLAKRLCNLGARPILDLGLGDDQHPSGHEAALDPWLAELWTKLDLECPEAQVSLASERYHHHDEESEESHPPFGKDVDGDLDPCRFAVETFAPTESESTPACAFAADPFSLESLCAAAAELDRVARAADPVDPKLLRGGVVGGEAAAAASANASPRGFANYAVATVTRNDPLTASDAVTETRHIELTLENLDHNHHHRRGGSCSFAYEPGDSLAVVPRGCGGASSEDEWSRGVDEVLRRAGVSPDAVVAVRPASTLRDSSSQASRFVPALLPARALVAGALDVASATPRRYFFEVASRYATDADERERLAHFASAAGRDELYRYNQRERRTVLEFLSDFPSVAMPLEWVLQTAPRLRPRLFSVSSSPETDGDATHLTVSLARWKTHYGRERVGLCSSALARTSPPGTRLAAWIVPGGLRAPPRDAPLVAVCAGSGAAPIRSLVRRRAAAARDGEKTAPALVFFGCRGREKDYLYREEWEAMGAPGGALAGTVAAPGVGGGPEDPRRWFVPAFSRDGPEKEYVQHKIRTDGARVWKMLSAGARVVVAGSSESMPQDVRGAFADVLAAGSGASPEEAEARLRRMEARGEYVVEAW